MDWKICAVDDLRRYHLMKVGILNSKDKLKAIEQAVFYAKTSSDGKKPKTNSEIVDMLVEKERLKTNITAAERIIELVERGLDALNIEERAILEKFYMTDCPNKIKTLRSQFGYSQRSMYRVKDRALRKFTLAMYGVEHL